MGDFQNIWRDLAEIRRLKRQERWWARLMRWLRYK